MARKGTPRPDAASVPKPTGFPRQRFEVQAGYTQEETAANAASVLTDPATAGMRVMRAAERGAGLDAILDVPAVMERLREEARAVNAGDLSQPEAMLLAQATALQSLFARLAERGMGCEAAAAFDVNMKYALMAQRQCTKALEALALLKQGPTVIARSANVVNGQQQVNVGVQSPAVRAGGADGGRADELLGTSDGKRMDTGTAGATGGANRVMAPVGALDGASNARGQGDGV